MMTYAEPTYIRNMLPSIHETMPATHDSLTGLHNQDVFKDFIEALSSEEHPYGLLTLDGDNLKHINDVDGYSAGDKRIVQIAEGITEIVRDADKIFVDTDEQDIHYGRAFRRSGDEFYIVLYDVDDIAKVNAVKQRIQEFLGLEVSIGAVVYEKGESVEELMQRSEVLLHEDKAARHEATMNMRQRIVIKIARKIFDHVGLAITRIDKKQG